MYQKVPTDLKFAERELPVLDFWRENRIFEKSVEWRRGCPTYTFYDGPPTANGMPHIGHVLTRSIKDLIPRYRSMKGFDVLRKAGWDTHGLPVELEVEKALGLDGKAQILEYGVEPFIHQCKESVFKYEKEWREMSERVAYAVDMDDPYVTYHDDYIESEWWALKTIHEKGLLYKGHKIVPYCPRCGTALASHEVAQGYKDVTEKSAIAKFYSERGCILAWTTTPWTLPGNVALCVNAKEVYVRAKRADDVTVYILAEALLPSVLGEETEVLERFPGADLVGLVYEPLFALPLDFGGKTPYRVVADAFVTLCDGTGVVHIAPAFGEDDNRVGKAHDLPFIQTTNTAGKLCGGTPWDGMFVKEADPMIIRDLKVSGKLFAALTYTHSYPHCWRCDSPLIYYARESWFIQMTAIKDKLIAFNKSVNWIPETIRDGRMGNFLENVIDWGVSRERYWGTPLPVWVCACGHVHVIGSRAELMLMSDNCPPDLELHKPYVDAVHVQCPLCGGTMQREPAVIDCWFDSGAMPFAQWHYPFENKELFESRYPANFISEAVDQTRGWFYTLLAIAACLFDVAPFENCVVLGLVCDKDGKKMSKHVGNVISPAQVLSLPGAPGADAVRWYFYTASAPWLPSRFSEEAVKEGQRIFMGTLWNTYAFFVLYADLDGFNPLEHPLDNASLTVMDRWILSRLHTLIADADAHLEHLRITEAGRALAAFVDELSNWYVRRCRDRFWGSGMSADKEAALTTLHTVLVTFAKLLAPFMPFLAEQIYQNLVCNFDKDAPESVHLCDYPLSDALYIDKELEKNMGRVLALVTLGRSARNSANMKVRQPLARLLAQGEVLPADYAAIVAEELNVRAVEFVEDASSYISYRVKPQLRTLGPRYGKLLGKISVILAQPGRGDEIVETHNRGKTWHCEVDGVDVALAKDDVLVSAEQKPGYFAESADGLSVVLDTTLTPELLEEGLVRELVSKLQGMRKDAGFAVADRIRIGYAGNARIAEIFGKYGDSICADTLAPELREAMFGFTKEWDINGELVTLSVERL
ncbi:MAG: isoleucine--tRNA ligase [Clostridiales bacterium]|nr:isoleucine--tRNA ligase [Clostridiales bacterium]